MKCGTCQSVYVDDGTIRYRSKRLEDLSDHVIGLGGKECHYCRREAVALVQVVPGDRGGCECVENLRAACYGCRDSRHSMTHSEWHSWLRGHAPGRLKKRRDDRFMDRCVEILWHWDRT